MIMRARDATGALVDLTVDAAGLLEVATTDGLGSRVTTVTAFDAQSVAASGTADSAAVDGSNTQRVRAVVDSSGANITLSLEMSADGGTTWHTLDTYAAGATGAQTSFLLPGPLFRLHASNAGVGAESVTARIVLERG